MYLKENKTGSDLIATTDIPDVNWFLWSSAPDWNKNILFTLTYYKEIQKTKTK